MGIIHKPKKYRYKGKYKSHSVYEDLSYKSKEEIDAIAVFKEKVANKIKGLKNSKKKSLGEKKIFDYLKSKGINFRTEKRFNKMLNYTNSVQLRLDFYLPDQKIAIEFDGVQHFKATKKFDTETCTLETRQANDRLKDEYCISKGIKMIRISYLEYNMIESILSKEIK